MLDDEINDILEKLDVNLTTLELRCKKKRLNEKVENNKNKLLNQLLDGETKVSKLLTDLEYEKIGTLPFFLKYTASCSMFYTIKRKKVKFFYFDFLVSR